jgi:hypothetical protein
LPRGSSRLPLLTPTLETFGYHGLAPWFFTLATTTAPPPKPSDATGLSRGDSRLPLLTPTLETLGCHGTSPVASSARVPALVGASVKNHGTSPWHPRRKLSPVTASPWHLAVCCKCRNALDATALCRGVSSLLLLTTPPNIRMPRPCAVESHRCCYRALRPALLPDATQAMPCRSRNGTSRLT